MATQKSTKKVISLLVALVFISTDLVYSAEKTTLRVPLAAGKEGRLKEIGDALKGEDRDNLVSDPEVREIARNLIVPKNNIDTPLITEVHEGFIETYRLWIREETHFRLDMLAKGFGGIFDKLDRYHSNITQLLKEAFGDKLPQDVESKLSDLKEAIEKAKKELDSYFGHRDPVDIAFNEMYEKNEALGKVLRELAGLDTSKDQSGPGLASNAGITSLSELQLTVAIFLGDEVVSNPELFADTIEKLDNSNQIVVIASDEAQRQVLDNEIKARDDIGKPYTVILVGALNINLDNIEAQNIVDLQGLTLYRLKDIQLEKKTLETLGQRV